MGQSVATVTLLFLILHQANAFYLPGIAPVNYCRVEEQSDSCKVSEIF